MKKNLKTIILIVIIVGFAFIYAHVDKNYYLYDRNQDTGEYIATGILQDENIFQEFIAQSDKINGIKVKSIVSGNVENVKITYYFVDKKSGETLAEGTIRGEEFENSKFYQIDFGEIKNTKGNTYVFIIKESGSDELNGIGFSIANQSDFQVNEKLRVKDNNTNGALVSRIICHEFDFETFCVFLLFIAYIVGFMKILYKLFK